MSKKPEHTSAFKRKLGVRVAQLRDRVTLNRIESGKGNPTIDTLGRIADGLDVTIEDLLTV